MKGFVGMKISLGKVAVITGAASGIGQALAIRLSQIIQAVEKLYRLHDLIDPTIHEQESAFPGDSIRNFLHKVEPYDIEL
jgi:NAD(P)-dependent dehydrogenase (short-subunit alcohol dehydrogenase family)